MSINKTYAVFGLGRYGKAVAEELVKNGAEVLGVDIDQDIVDNAVETIPVCKCADITEAEVIKRLGIFNMDIVIVSMANNLEASVMAVTLCKEAGVETVIAKCASEMQEKILKRVGADRVVFPERESGIRLGRSLITSGFSEMIELSKEVSMTLPRIPHTPEAPPPVGTRRIFPCIHSCQFGLTHPRYQTDNEPKPLPTASSRPLSAPRR